MSDSNQNHKPVVKVCLAAQCQERMGEAVFEALRAGLWGEATVLSIPHCFGHCSMGVNVAVNGNILHGLTPSTCLQRVSAELRHPSLKSDGLGTAPLSDLDRVLDDITGL